MNEDNLNCFLCCTSILPSKTESFKTITAYSSPPLENNLDVVFLLRNLLQVPSTHLFNQLKDYGDNPEEWISLCDQCTQLARNARNLHHEINKIEKQLETIQKQALHLIRTSQICNAMKDDKFTPFQEKIRCFVNNNEYPHLDKIQIRSGFLEGDKLAKYLESQGTSSQQAELKEELILSAPVSPASPEGLNFSEDEDVRNLEVASPESVESQVFLCDHCGKEFSKMASMKIHVTKSHKAGKVKDTTCYVFGKTFPGRPKIMLKHLLSKHRNDPITKKFQEETGLFWRRCSETGCNTWFMKQLEEDAHMAKVHPNGGNTDIESRPFKCRFCGFGFWCRHLCWRHERIHVVKGKIRHNTKWRPSKSNEQGKGSNEKEIPLDKRFKCDDCGKSYSRAKGWSDHVWKMHNKRDITCPGVECGMVFRGTLVAFQDQWKRNHWGEIRGDGAKKKIVCDICGVSKVSPGMLYEHQKNAHQVNGEKMEREKRVNSKFVGAEKKKGSTLKEVEEGTCTICGKKLKNKNSLDKHVKFLHDKKFGLSCPLCGVEIRVKSALKIHLLEKHGKDPIAKKLEKEEGLKLRRCGVKGCNGKFLREELLDKHVEKWHGGKEDKREVRLKCKFCGKGFRMRLGLRAHERIHEAEGRKDFKCVLCGKGFGTRRNLWQHLQITHKQAKKFQK